MPNYKFDGVIGYIMYLFVLSELACASPLVHVTEEKMNVTKTHQETNLVDLLIVSAVKYIFGSLYLIFVFVMLL